MTATSVCVEHDLGGSEVAGWINYRSMVTGLSGYPSHSLQTVMILFAIVFFFFFPSYKRELVCRVQVCLWSSAGGWGWLLFHLLNTLGAGTDAGFRLDFLKTHTFTLVLCHLVSIVGKFR